MPQVRDPKTGRYSSGGSSVGGAAGTNPRVSKAAAVGNGATAGGAPTTSTKKAGRFSEDNFPQTRPGVWESKKQTVDAAVIRRNDAGESIGVTKSTAPKYTIMKDGDKYKMYETHLNRGRTWIKTEKSLEKAFKYLDKYDAAYDR